MAKEVIEIVVKTGKAQTNTKKLNTEIGKSGKGVSKLSKGFKASFAGMRASVLSMVPALNMFKAAMVSTGVGALIVAAGALITVLAKAAKVGAEFGKGVSTLRAVTGQTAEELSVLTEQAKELGATTAFTAKQVLDLQTELAKLGFSIRDIENSTPAILDLAASLEVDLGSAAAFAGATVKAFGLSTEETQRVVDVMALSTSRSALDFDKLRESLKMVAPVASAANVSVEKTTALLGALADRGIAGSMAGTGLSKTFIELSKKGMTLEEAMDQVNNSSNKLNTAIELVGAVGGKSLLNLASTGSEKLNELEQQFMNAEGSAKSMAEVRLDNLEGDMTKLGSAWEGFLLGIEDGEGPINDLQRSLTQGLTWVLSNLGKVVDFLAFTFKENWDQIKLTVTAGVNVTKGLFKILGGAIGVFSQKVLIAISKVPILGSGIDVGAAKKRMKAAKDIITSGARDIENGIENLKEAATKRMTMAARFRANQEGKAERTEKARQDKITQAEEQQRLAEREKLSEEARKKAADQRKKDLEKIASIEDKYKKMSEDAEDTSAKAKAARKRERALAEIEALKLSETEKREAIKQVNDYFDGLDEEAKKKDEETRKQEEEKAKQDLEKKQTERLEEYELKKEFDAMTFEEQRLLLQERRDAILGDELLSEEQKSEALLALTDKEEELEERKRAMKQKTLDNAIAIAGADTGVGKGLLVAKQLLQAKEMIMEAKGTLFKAKSAVTDATLEGTKAGAAVAAGTAKTAAIGFPQNIPMLIGYAAQAVSIVSAIKKAVSTAKKAGAKAGFSGGGNANIQAPSGSGGGSTPPAFNIVGQSGTNQLAEAMGSQTQEPIQAYVVSNDVTTAQSMERNTIDGASIG